MVDDFAGRTMEDQYKIYSEIETVFDLISPSSRNLFAKKRGKQNQKKPFLKRNSLADT